MRPNEALTEGFGLWLESTSGRIRQGRRMDPMATSFRALTKAVVGRLQEIRDTSTLSGISERSRNQALIDLAQAKLIVRAGAGIADLSDLGSRVLTSWEEHGITEEPTVHELARNMWLIRHALESSDLSIRQYYLSMYESWKRLVQLQPCEYWFADLHIMMLPCYLDQEDERGYNPFNVLVAANDGHLGTADDWYEWATSEWQGAENLQALLDRIKNSHRRGGAEGFRRSLHLLYTSQERPDEFPALLDSWGFSE